MGLRRFALVLVAVGAGALLGALPASAKEDTKATLTTNVALDAPTGTQLAVSWKLFFLDENDERQPFNAEGVFVRLLSSSRAASEEGVAPGGAHLTGEYEATVAVPKGGIRDIEIGLTGWVSDAKGTRRSDLTFPITNDPIPSPAPIPSAAPHEPAPGGSEGTSSWALALVASLLSVLALTAGAVLVHKRRGSDATAPAERVGLGDAETRAARTP